MKKNENSTKRKCRKCGECAIEIATQVVDFDGVVDVEAKVSKCASCGAESTTFHHLEELVQQIAQVLTENDRRLRPDELRWLRKFIGASSKDWARYIGRSHETLSRWENDHEEYPLAFERLLRLVVLKGPMDWDYQGADLRPADAKKRPSLSPNSVGQWVQL